MINTIKTILEPTPQRRDLAFLSLRLILGAVFIYHGSQKLFGAFAGPGLEGFAAYLTQLGVPAPGLNALLASSAEFFGGLALLTGIAAQLAVVPLIITMLVATLTAHSGFNVTTGGSEYTLVLAVAALVIGLVGPGKYTVLNLLGKAAQEPSLKLAPDNS